jgi:hypothetical protein
MVSGRLGMANAAIANVVHSDLKLFLAPGEGQHAISPASRGNAGLKLCTSI